MKRISGFKSFAFLSLAILFVFSAAAFGQKSARSSSELAPSAIIVENFDQPAGTLLTNSGWTAHSGGGTNAVTVTAPGLTLAGYPGSGVGNAVSMTTSGEDVNRPFAPISTGTVYAAFLVNISEASTDPAGGYFVHLGPSPVGTTFRGRVFAKKDAGNNVAFGISKALTTAADIQFTGFTFSLNTTYVIVVKYTIVDGVTNDTVAMYVGTNLPATEPAMTVTATDTTQTDVSIGTFSLRQGTAATSPTARVDGIRISNSWASISTPAPAANADFNGDGRTDIAVARGTATPFSGSLLGFDPEVKGGRPFVPHDASDSPQAPQIWWYTSANGAGGANITPFGDAATDFFVPEDYDGDGKTDIAIWRPGAPTVAAFYILQSGTSTVRIERFGQTNDDPAITGDYDGDGKSDIAVYRCPALGAGDGQCFFFYRGTNANPGGNTTYVPWGFGERGDFFPLVGDFDGDNKNDFCIQRSNPSATTLGQFLMLKSGGGVEFIDWGNSGDFLIPGDYDGDGRSDICVRRTVAGVRQHWLLTRAGATSVTEWGIAADVSVPGDYDGDGRTDFAIWRPNADPNQNNFWIRNSSSGSVSIIEWGAQNDFAVAGWAVH